jgi:hypothetical protein
VFSEYNTIGAGRETTGLWIDASHQCGPITVQPARPGAVPSRWEVEADEMGWGSIWSWVNR